MLGVVEFDPNTIGVALITLLGVWVTSRGNRRRIEDVHAEVRSNHGHTNGQYSEEAARATRDLILWAETHDKRDDLRFNGVDARFDLMLTRLGSLENARGQGTERP